MNEDDYPSDGKATVARIGAKLDALHNEFTDYRSESRRDHLAVQAAIADMKANINVNMVPRSEFDSYRKDIFDHSVQRGEFRLVQNIVLGACAIVLIGFMGAVMAISVGWSP